MPAPVCKSADYSLKSLSDIQPNTAYLGDPAKANWVSSGKPVTYNGDSILLTMAPDTVGTLLASTHYVWYGKITATMTSSQGAGVITAFIMMSDVKDEIDFEFVGTDIGNVQSNYYAQGIIDCMFYPIVRLLIGGTDFR
jgi:beta-glucanase (GH16 family)